MKKYLLLFVPILLCVILSSCAEVKSSQSKVENSITKVSENEKLMNAEISREQISRIWELCSEQLLSDTYIVCKIDDISNIAEIKQVKEFVADNKKYYFNCFSYADYKLILVYDESGILYGSIFYNNEVSYKTLSECKTFDDVKRIDSTLEDDKIAINTLSVEMLLRLTGYQVFDDDYNEALFDEKTLHFTDKGLLFVGYKLSETNKLVVSDMEPVDNPVYNKVYRLLTVRDFNFGTEVCT